jgi:hypothetical protein
MTAIPFDTYTFYDELVKSGLAEKTADALTKAVTKIEKAKLDELATKRDLAELELRIEQVRREIEVMRTEAQTNKVDLIKWFVGTAFAIASIGFMLARFFQHGVL